MYLVFIYDSAVKFITIGSDNFETVSKKLF